jgi:hypothetical protein
MECFERKMMVEYSYSNTLDDGRVITTVMKVLQQEGHQVPGSFEDLLNTEPFQSEHAAAPMQRGRKRTPFQNASPHADGLRLDLYQTPEYDDMIVDIARGILSEYELLNENNGIAQENVLHRGSLRFVKREDSSKTQDVHFMAYHR